MISKDHKLKKYYRAVQFSGPASILIVGAFIFFFPSYFLFLGPTHTVVRLILAVFVAHTFFFFMHEIFKRKIFFTLFRFSWVAFFACITLTSGGLGSPLVYLFSFPILVAATDFEIKDVKMTAYVIFGFLISLFLWGKGVSPERIFLHGFEIFVLYIVYYFVSVLVKEKEAIHRDFDRLRAVEHIESDFISIASNRLRTPLTGALYALTELSEQDTLNAGQKKVVAGGLEHVKMANAVVNELVHAVELDAYHFKIFPEIVDVPKVIREIESGQEVMIKKKGVAFSIFSPAVLTIQANPGMIKLALGNIIENAIMYSPGGKVEITISEVMGSCEILVRDNGIGIIEDDLPLISERLYRGSEAVRLEPNRTGIGIYAAKRIIELHHGTFDIFSKVEKGTTVRITLPMV